MMLPPSGPRFAGRCLLVVLCVALVGAGTAPASGVNVDSTTQSATQPCGDDQYDPPALDTDWMPAFSDPLANGSLTDWTGGDLARVGGTGDCSLVVTGNDTATLTVADLDRNGGVLTAALDLGADGSLSLVGANETVLSVSNPGPSYADTLTVVAANESVTERLPTGRFVSLAVTVENGITQVALWDAGAGWDGEWDAQVETTTEPLQVRLDGEVFLDGLAIGTLDEPEATSTETTSNTDESGADPSDDDSNDGVAPSGDEPEDFEYDVSDDSQPPYNDASGSSNAAMGGFVLLIGGVGYFFAYELALFGEQMNAIGSKTPASEVEPADWNVALTKFVSALIALGGLWLLVAPVF